MKLTKSKLYNNVYSYKAKNRIAYAFRYIYYDLAGKRHEKERGSNVQSCVKDRDDVYRR